MNSIVYREFLNKGGVHEKDIPSLFKQGKFMVILESLVGFLLFLIVQDNPKIIGEENTFKFLNLLFPYSKDSKFFNSLTICLISFTVFRFVLFFLLGEKEGVIETAQKVSTFIASLMWGLAFYFGAFLFDKNLMILFSLVILFVISGWCVTTVDFRYTLLFALPVFFIAEFTIILHNHLFGSIPFSQFYILLFISIVYSAYRIGKNHKILFKLAENIQRERQETEIAQKALFESECEYRHLIQYSNGIILKLDAEGRILFMNDYGLSFFGYEWSEVKGKFITETILPTDEANTEKIGKVIQSVLADTETFAQLELENRRKDGSIVYINWRNSLVQGIKKNEEILSFGSDITESVKAREALKQREQELRDLLDAIPIAISITNADTGKYLFVNNSAFTLFKVPKEKMGEVHVHMFVVDPKVREGFLERLKKNPETIVSGEMLLRDFFGNEFWVIISYALFSYNGANAILAGIQDISKQKRVEEILASARKQAEDSNQLKDKFVSLISHDLRGPIGGIQTMASMLNSPDYIESNSIEQRNKMIELIEKSSSGLLEMLSQLLNITRLKTGNIVPFKKEVIARQLVENISSGLQIKMSEMGIIFENIIPHDCKIFGDEHLIGEVFSNLITNAMKFTPSNGRIVISLIADNDDYTVISVYDTGNGIPAKILPNLFRHDIKTSLPGLHGEKGTGLGLPYCFDIIKSHGGKIDVTSEVGKGTKFEILLPKSRPIIMIVDDLEVHRIMAKDAFLKANLSVDIIEAGNGNQAIEFLQNISPSLFLVDIHMPGMDGWELVREIKLVERFSKTPILVMTSSQHSEKEFLEQKSKFNLPEAIVKPINPQDLIHRVKEYLY